MTARIHRLKTGKMEPVSVYIQIRTGPEGRILKKNIFVSLPSLWCLHAVDSLFSGNNFFVSV